jgi:U3 small nucleolar RNA-associated protein 10
MASVLSQQLAQLAARKGPQEHYVRGKPSLLFTFQKAADVDVETIYNITITGKCPCEPLMCNSMSSTTTVRPQRELRWRVLVTTAGLKQLCRLDPRVKSFADSLFSRTAITLDRDQLTREEDAALSQNIRSFLYILSNNFMSPAAFQVLEFMIRRYK